jgi:CRP-like cAMP-binding protein
MDAARPSAFGRYELIDLLAIGGMAEIFLARARIGGIVRPCVIKRVLPEFSSNRQFVSMFIDEARITVGLEHENIVRLLDFGQVDGAYFMAIEYVDGVDLVDVLRAVRARGEGVPPLAAASITRSVARGLHAAHLARDHRGRPLGVVHRDVSPHNVFLAWNGGVKIGDFGIAAARNKLSRTTPGVVMGKFGYMSPEQASGDPIDARTDIWAAGVVLWEMLVGARLFATDSPVDTVARVMGLTVPAPSSVRPTVPAALDAICRRALLRPLGERTETAAALADQLDAFIAGQDGEAAVTGMISFLGLDSRRGTTTRLRGGAPSSALPDVRADAGSVLATPTMPGTHDAEIQQLAAAMRKNPSLALIADLGVRYAAIGLREEAVSAIRTAAFHYAHRGLLVPAVCAVHALRGLVEPEAYRASLAVLANLRGAPVTALVEAMRCVQHRAFTDAIVAADADAGSVTATGLEPTFVPTKAPLLAMLSTADFVTLVEQARVERRPAGTPLVVEGEVGDALYAVGRGCVVVHTNRAPASDAAEPVRSYLAALGEGDFFGELSFLTRSPRTATVEAITDVTLLRIDRGIVDSLAAAETAFRVHLVDFYKERVAELVLAKNPILGALPPETRRGLVAVAEVRRFRAGDMIVREDDEADELFLLLAGEAEVLRMTHGFPVFIDKLTVGQLFGEMAALRGTKRTASVRAMGDVEALSVHRADIEAALAADGQVRQLLLVAMKVREAQSDARVLDTERIFQGT